MAKASEEGRAAAPREAIMDFMEEQKQQRTVPPRPEWTYQPSNVTYADKIEGTINYTSADLR